MKERRGIILGQTLALMAVYAGAIWLVDELLGITPRALSLGIAFALVQIAGIAILLAVLFGRKTMQMRRAERQVAMRQEINDTLAAHALGTDRLAAIVSLAERSRRDVEHELTAMVTTLAGSPRDRLVDVAHQLSIAIPDETLRIHQKFARAVHGNLFERAVLTEELEPHAASLADGEISRAMASGDAQTMLTGLDMVRAWRRVIEVRDFGAALTHPDAAVRARAQMALPFVIGADAKRAVDRGLADQDPSVRAAAAASAGRLKVESAAPALLRAISDPSRDVAIAAAFAIGSLANGAESLRRISTSRDRASAQIAFEALEKISIGRLETT